MAKEITSVEFKISAWTVLKILVVLGAAWLVYYLSDIIAGVIVALIFAAIIDPAINWFEKKRIPRPIGVVIIYIIFFSLLALVISLVVPFLIREIRELASNFSYLWEKVIFSLVGFREYSNTISGLPQAVANGLNSLQDNLTQAIKGIFLTITGVFGGIISFIGILVITFYIVIQENGLKKMFYNLIPGRHVEFVADLVSKIQKKISMWVRGQLILCFIVGLAAYLGLLIFQVKYALLLGILAGLTEIVPYAGPFIGGAVAVLFALAQSPFKAFLVVILYIIIQQLENNLLVPKVMQKAVGLNPIVSILALLVGFRLGGITGALFAIPIATVLDIVLHGILQYRSEGKS